MCKQAVQRAVYWIHEQMLTTAGKCFYTYRLNYLSEVSYLLLITNETSRKALISIMTSACPIGELEADARPLKPASHNEVLGTNGEGKTSKNIFIFYFCTVHF